MSYTLYLGNGDIISAYADEAVVVGDVVYATSGDDAVTTATATYTASDVTVEKCDAAYDNRLALGVALTSASSGAQLSVVTQGLFIMSGASVTAGSRLVVSGVGNALMDGDCDTTDHAAGSIIGRALTGTSAATAKFCLANLDWR